MHVYVFIVIFLLEYNTKFDIVFMIVRTICTILDEISQPLSTFIYWQCVQFFWYYKTIWNRSWNDKVIITDGVLGYWYRHCILSTGFMLDDNWRKKGNTIRIIIQDALANLSGNLLSLGATIYASRFAVNALYALRLTRTRKARLK